VPDPVIATLRWPPRLSISLRYGTDDADGHKVVYIDIGIPAIEGGTEDETAAGEDGEPGVAAPLKPDPKHHRALAGIAELDPFTGWVAVTVHLESPADSGDVIGPVDTSVEVRNA